MRQMHLISEELCYSLYNRMYVWEHLYSACYSNRSFSELVKHGCLGMVNIINILTMNEMYICPFRAELILCLGHQHLGWESLL